MVVKNPRPTSEALPRGSALTRGAIHSTMALQHHDPKGHPPPMSARTQIHLSDQQRQALELLLAASDQPVSDLVRQAVERLLSDELAGEDWGARLDALMERIRSQIPEPTTAEVAEALRRSRLKRKGLA